MPTPKKGERKKNFIKRCIPHLYDNESDTLTSKDNKNKQAYAICNSLYDKNESIISFEKFNEKYSYMNDDDTKKLKKLVEPFIINSISKIETINIYHYIDNYFINENVWNNILQQDKYENNIYGLVDKNFRVVGIETPTIRNSLYKIIKKTYKKYNINTLLDEKLINIVEKDPKKYPIILDNLHEISEYVKKSLEWIGSSNKYNL